MRYISTIYVTVYMVYFMFGELRFLDIFIGSIDGLKVHIELLLKHVKNRKQNSKRIPT